MLKIRSITLTKQLTVIQFRVFLVVSIAKRMIRQGLNNSTLTTSFFTTNFNPSRQFTQHVTVDLLS
jgi:hypothetical protein